MKQLHRQFAVLLFGSVLFIGCRPPPEQYEVESKAIFSIMDILKFNDSKFPGGHATKGAQVFAGQEQGYPYEWHRRFAAYGKHAGFENSIYEKYLFFPPGLTNRYVRGEIVVMNAKPYPGPRGPQRSIISKDTVGYHWMTHSEHRVQQIFKEAEIAEPDAPRMPAPPPAPPESADRESLFRRIQIHFFSFAEAHGWDSTIAIPLWYLVLSLPVLVLLTVTIVLWRRSR